MPKFHIDEVCPKESMYPMILNFQNGYTTDHFQNKQTLMFENDITDAKSIATELNGLIYTGDEENEELGKTLILARNKNTGKVRLIEVGCAELKPVFKVSSEPSHLDTSNLELSRKFGSKKMKKRFEQSEKLKVNVDTVKEQMENVSQAYEKISENRADISLFTKSDSDEFYIPPIDRYADTPEDIYDLNKIMTEDEYEVIYSELADTDYVSKMPTILKGIDYEKLPRKQTVLAVYAASLLKSYELKAKDMKKDLVICPHSATLNRIIIANFTQMSNGRRTRSFAYKEKTFCYAVVFILIANGFKFQLESLCKATKMSVATATNKVRITGATVVSTAGKKIVQLKLPLPQKLSSNRRKSAKF